MLCNVHQRITQIIKINNSICIILYTERIRNEAIKKTYTKAAYIYITGSYSDDENNAILTPEITLISAKENTTSGTL